MSIKEATQQQIPDTAANEVDGAQNEEPGETTPLPEFLPPPKFAGIPTAVQPRPLTDSIKLDDPVLYFNQELSWIDFNWRVIALAMDERTPLLERVRFVAITAANLDEFVQKRVGGLKRQQAAGVRKLTSDGRTPSEQLSLIHDAIATMHSTMTEIWETELRPALATHAGIKVCDYEDLNEGQRLALHKYFKSEIYPILTPLAVDPGHPFPFISNLSLSLAIILRHGRRGTRHFARIKIPISRWLPVPGADDENGSLRYVVPAEQLFIRHVGDLFPGMDVLSVHPFRITRNADLRRDEEEAEDLLEMISAELRERRFAPVVRLEVASSMPESERRLLARELGLKMTDVCAVNGLLDLTDCFAIADMGPSHLKYESWAPVVPYRLRHEGETKDTKDLFAIIRQGDLLVHHPYDSFTASTQRLIEEAAADDRVLAIKQTLYRTSDESPIVSALIHAAESGKQVAVLVEVKARFDEATNIEWGRRLENAGVHVTYGLVGLKTHTKATLIVRRERDGLRTYCHIGTGNYNSQTASLYTDLGLLTCDPELGADLVNLFHFLTGYAPEQDYGQILIAPSNMRAQFNELIEQEIRYQKQDGNGRIVAKMNALDDPKMIRRLYAASQAGVKVDLIIRGHCCLRPGLAGYSDNIRVISILGRFLEHDRIYYFQNSGRPLVLMGSADWRTRNLKRRVELITPVREPALQERMIHCLEAALDDNRLVWELDSSGHYSLRQPTIGEKARSFHDQMMKEAKKRARRRGITLS